MSWATRGYLTDSSGAARLSSQLVTALQKLIDEADLIVGFNLKFDYHWLTKIGLRLDHKRLYDCQLAEFVLTRQQHKYPSLEDTATKYGIGHKLDVVKLEYWDKGIDTDAVPWPVLKEYATQDAVLTLLLYEAQQAHINPLRLRLLSILFEDIKVLAEMEHNGLIYDETLCTERGKELETAITKHRNTLNAFYPTIPINWASPDQLSAFLYGGVVKEEKKEHIGFFKTGIKAGQPKYQNVVVEHQLPRLYVPLRGSAMAKEGLYSTSEDTLLKLSGKRGPLTVLLELSKMEKMLGTYYQGFPKKNAKMNWPQGTLHGSFNQCSVTTGRLSSSDPNLQNLASDMQDIFISRYAPKS